MQYFLKYKLQLIILQLIIYLIYCLNELKKLIPFYFKNSDPAYEYLINGINLVYGMSPGHADHPGSTLQWLLSLTNRFYFMFFGVSINLKTDFVNYPENYAVFFSLVSMVLHILVLILITLKLIKIFDNKYFAFYPFAYLICCLGLLDQVIGIKPENLLLFFSNLFLFAILHFEDKKNFNKYLPAIIYGSIFALGISTKMTFILLLPIILFITGLKAKLLFIFIFILEFLIINLKLIGVFSIKWFVNIFINGGRYGQDQSINIIDIGSNVKNIFIYYPYLAINIFIIFGCLILGKYKEIIKSFDNRVYRISFIFILFTSLLIFKDSLPRDFIILLPFLSLLTLINVIYLFKIIKRGKELLGITLMLIILILISKDNSWIGNDKKNISKKSYENFVEAMSTKGNIVISDYDAPTQFSALQFGNAMYGNSAVNNEIDAKYPTSLFIVGSTIYNGKVDVIGCKLFSNFLKEDRKIFVLTRSLNDLRVRIISSPHSYNWTYSSKYVFFPDSGLDWKIYEVIAAECKK